jgi:hypothetical protein
MLCRTGFLGRSQARPLSIDRFYVLQVPDYHILKTPNLVSGASNLPPRAASSPRASICRVRAGGMTPSSQSLADENAASLSLSMRSLSSGSTDFPTVSITAVNWSGPITLILALGHIHKNRGEYARPLSKSADRTLNPVRGGGHLTTSRSCQPQRLTQSPP